MNFMLGKQLVFLDSFQFITSSLDKLVGNLPKEALRYTLEEFEDEKLNLMSQKCVYPYDFIDSLKKFEKQNYQRKKISIAF